MEPKPDRLQREDLAGLKLAYSSIAGIVAQLADIAQDSEPDDDLGATLQHLGASMRHLAGSLQTAQFNMDITPEAPDAE